MSMSILCFVSMFIFITTAHCKSCSINTSTRTTIECDVSNLNTTHLQWRAYGSASPNGLTLYTCEMANCTTVTPLLNNTLEVTIEKGETNVMFSVLVVPRTVLYFNEYSQYSCFAGEDVSVCKTPDIYADVIDPICDVLIISSIYVIVKCRALTHFEPKDFDFIVKTNNQTRDSHNVTGDHHETHVLTPIDSVPYYAVNYTLDTDLVRLGPGQHEFILDVHSVTFGGTIASAFLKVMPEAINPKCDYPRLTNTRTRLLVRCTTALMYPQLLCDFNVRTNDVLVNVTGEVSYSTSGDPNSSPTGYLSECTLYINISQLGAGSHEFQVVMYTNGSYDNSTRVPGVFTSPYQLILPTAQLDYSCIDKANSLYGKYWSTMNCLCVLGTAGNPVGDVVWYIDNKAQWGNVVFADFQYFVKNVTYECRPTSPLQDNLPGVQLKIEVPRTPYIASFTVNSRTSNITVAVNTTIYFRCDADGFPEPILFFGKNNSGSAEMYSGRIIATHIQECLDAGLYCCTVKNSSFYTVTRQCLPVYVECPLLPRTQNTICVTSLPGMDADVIIPVQGYPAPTHYTLTLAERQHEIIDPSHYKLIFKEETPPYGEIDVTLLKIVESNFTKFSLEFGNGFGSNQNFSFSLVKGKSEGGSNDEIRNIALGVTGGVVTIIIIVVVIILVKRGSCSKIKRTATYDADRFTQMY